MKRVLGNRVLIEQTMTSKVSKVVLTPEQKKNPENFNIEKRVIMVGDEVDELKINVGDIPVFGKYATEESIKVISSSDEKMIAHIVMHVENIVGIDNEPDIK